MYSAVVRAVILVLGDNVLPVVRPDPVLHLAPSIE